MVASCGTGSERVRRACRPTFEPRAAPIQGRRFFFASRRGPFFRCIALTKAGRAVTLRPESLYRYIYDENLPVPMIDMPTSQEVLIPLMLTLKVATWATLLATSFGIATAFALARLRFPGREVLDAVMTLPMVMPPTVLGYYLLVLVGRRGIIGEWLYDNLGISLVFTWQGAVIAAAVVAFPLIYKAARAAFEGVERQYEQAARALGQSEFEVFIRVTLPLAWRGILAGAMLAFARALGEFGATLMVAGSLPGRTQTLSIAVYEAVQAGKDDVANYLVVVTSIVCISILLASGRLLQPRYAS